MRSTWIRAMSIGLVVFVIDVAEPASVHRDLSGTHPTTFGLQRLERDLLRKL